MRTHMNRDSNASTISTPNSAAGSFLNSQPVSAAAASSPLAQREKPSVPSSSAKQHPSLPTPVVASASSALCNRSSRDSKHDQRIGSPESNGSFHFSNIPPLNFAPLRDKASADSRMHSSQNGNNNNKGSSSRIYTPISTTPRSLVASTGSTPRRDVASPISPSSSTGFILSPRSAFVPSSRSSARSGSGLSSYRSACSTYVLMCLSYSCSNNTNIGRNCLVCSLFTYH